MVILCKGTKPSLPPTPYPAFTLLSQIAGRARSSAKTFLLLSRLHKKMNAIWTDPIRYEYNDIAIMREEAELSKKL
jgi:hypothetical protein